MTEMMSGMELEESGAGHVGNSRGHMMTQDFDPSTWEAKGEGSEFKASLVYIVSYRYTEKRGYICSVESWP